MSLIIKPSLDLQRALLAALRGERPPEGAPAQEVEACLRLYECGGALHRAWKGRGGGLPEPWAGAATRAHHKTLVDNLAAMAQLREVAAILGEAGVPFILLKGAGYLAELHDDAGCRPLTDIDLLVREETVGRAARTLFARGYQGDAGVRFPEFRRFEMWRPGPGPCHFEFHWHLGMPGRMSVRQEELWRTARPVALNGIPALALSHETALLYHVGHMAEHYFGPTLKWVLDLRLMLQRWEVPAILARCEAWGLRGAMFLALSHVDRLHPGDPILPALQTVATRAQQRRLSRFLSRDPIDLLDLGDGLWRRSAFRLALLDKPTDVLAFSLHLATRSAAFGWNVASGRARAPWLRRS